MLTIPLFHNWPSIPTLRTTTSLNSSIVTFRIETSLFCQSQNMKFTSSRRKLVIWKPSTDNCICTCITFSTKRKSFFSRKNKYQYQTFKYIFCFYVCFFFLNLFWGKGVFVVFVLFCFVFLCFWFFLRVVTWQRNNC